MKYTVLILLIILLIISSCKINLTGSLINDPEVKKYTVKEEQFNQEEKTKELQENKIVNAEQKDCNQTIKELSDDYVDLQIELGEIESKKRKLAGEINYYKDAIYEEERYKEKLATFEDASKQSKEIRGKLDDQVSALKLMSEKCKIKVRLFRN